MTHTNLEVLETGAGGMVRNTAHEPVPPPNLQAASHGLAQGTNPSGLTVAKAATYGETPLINTS